jgi:hypothetical protein
MSASDLYILNEASPQEIQEGIAEVKRRCASIIQHVFSRPIDVQRDFSLWLDEWIKSSGDPVFILHDEPLYVVARYLGLDATNLPSNVLALAEKLSVRENWY